MPARTAARLHQLINIFFLVLLASRTGSIRCAEILQYRAVRRRSLLLETHARSDAARERDGGQDYTAGQVRLSRTVYGMWRLEDQADTSPESLRTTLDILACIPGQTDSSAPSLAIRAGAISQ